MVFHFAHLCSSHRRVRKWMGWFSRDLRLYSHFGSQVVTKLQLPDCTWTGNLRGKHQSCISIGGVIIFNIHLKQGAKFDTTVVPEKYSSFCQGRWKCPLKHSGKIMVINHCQEEGCKTGRGSEITQHPTSVVPHNWENSEGIKVVRGIKSLSRRTDLSSWKAISSSKGKNRSIRNLTLRLCKGMNVLRVCPAHEHGSGGGLCRLLLRRGHQRWPCPLSVAQFLTLKMRKYEPYSIKPKKDGHYSSPGLKNRHM